MTTLGMRAYFTPMVAKGRLTPGKKVTREISLSEVNSIIEGMNNFTTKGTFVVRKYEIKIKQTAH